MPRTSKPPGRRTPALGRFDSRAASLRCMRASRHRSGRGARRERVRSGPPGSPHECPHQGEGNAESRRRSPQGRRDLRASAMPRPGCRQRSTSDATGRGCHPRSGGCDAGTWLRQSSPIVQTARNGSSRRAGGLSQVYSGGATQRKEGAWPSRSEIESSPSPSPRQRAPRTGAVLEVLRGDPSPRYRIEWDDGHTTSYTPAAGALHAARKPAGTTS